MSGYSLAGDIAHLTLSLAGQPPEDRPIIDVQNGADVISPGILQRLPTCLVHLRSGKMRAGDQERFARSDKGLVKIARVEGHVRTVLAVEYQWEGLPVLQPKQDQRSQTILILDHMADVAALPRQGLDQGTPHVIVPDARQHGGLQPEPGTIAGDIPG